MSLLNPLYVAVAKIIVWFHAGLSFLGPNWSWAMSIVLLTVAMRLLLFPLFVKQVRSQRAMQLLQPKMQDVRKKYADDKQKQNEMMMALYKETGVNPFAGCLPLIVQMPIFLALFRVLEHLKPDSQGHYIAQYGLSAGTVRDIANASVFGTPIAAAFNSPVKYLQDLGASSTTVKVVTALFILAMAATSFVTSRQLMARNKASQGGMPGPQANQMKLMMYGMPIFFALLGYRFQLGVLLYWVTTNVWSMGQQFFVIRRMDDAALAGGGTIKARGGLSLSKLTGERPWSRGGRVGGRAGDRPDDDVVEAHTAIQEGSLPDDFAVSPEPSRPASTQPPVGAGVAARRPPGKPNKGNKRKTTRRGGRR